MEKKKENQMETVVIGVIVIVSTPSISLNNPYHRPLYNPLHMPLEGVWTMGQMACCGYCAQFCM